jgi:hypothetical protein
MWLPTSFQNALRRASRNSTALSIRRLNDVVVKRVYSDLEPENPGLRPAEVEYKSFSEVAELLAARLTKIKTDLNSFDHASWKSKFISSCEVSREELESLWKEEWLKLCSGKRLVDDVYREFSMRMSKFDFKRNLAKRMKNEQTEDWTLVRSKIRDALGI